MSIRLVDEERGGGDEEADDSDGEAEKEVGAVAGEEGDGAEDDRDLEEGFAEIVAGGLGFRVGDFAVEFVGSLLFFGDLGLPLFDVGLCTLRAWRWWLRDRAVGRMERRSTVTERLFMRIFWAWYSFHWSAARDCMRIASVWVRWPRTVTMATRTARMEMASEMTLRDWPSPWAASLSWFANS